MSRLFKRKKGNLEETGFKKLAEQKKVRIANWLGKKTSGCSPLQLRAGLFVFCLLFGGICFYMLAGALGCQNSKRHVIVITHLRAGMPRGRSDTVSDTQFLKAERVKRWLDSVRICDSMRYKAILSARPFLLTNIQLTERIYQSQKK